ncbi:type VI secretion system protein TssA [soil metagenome]
MNSIEADRALVEKMLAPLAGDDGPCGVDLEYDNAFLELLQAAAGKADTQFAPASPPNWPLVKELAEALFDRTRDLRVAVLWTRAVVNVSGLSALSSGLNLITGLIEASWDSLHPLLDPDDGQAFARANALAPLPLLEGLLGDVKNALIFNLRGVGELRVRTIEISLRAIPPREGEPLLSPGQMAEMAIAASAEDPSLLHWPAAAAQSLRDLMATIRSRFPAEDQVDLSPLALPLQQVIDVMPSLDRDASDEAAARNNAAGFGTGSKLSGVVQSREEAVFAIDLVCTFLERTEPTNPAPLLLRRARRLINRNFLQLMKELAPDSLAEVARVMGVDPETISLDD